MAIALGAYAVVGLLRPTTQRHHRLFMTTDVSRRNVLLAEQVRAEAARRHLDIVLTSKEYGTLDALEEIDSPSDVKLALVIGGVTSQDNPHVRTVTTLTKEYLHLLVKPDLADKGIAGLHGKRIFLGPPTTASHHLARDVLDFVGLRPTAGNNDGGYFTDATSREQTLRELTRIAALKEPDRTAAVALLPDAIMVLAPLPSPFVKPLITEFGYTLMPLPFASAYGMDHLNPRNVDGVHIERSVLTPGVIPAYSYHSESPNLAKECPTICAPLILVADDDVPPEAVVALLESIYDSPLRSAIRAPALDEQVNTFPRHAGTERYLHRNDPFLTPEVASRLGTLIGGTGAFVSGAIALYGFLRLRSLNRFESYYREIAEIEMLAYGLQDDPAAPREPEARRAYLAARLTTLKCQVLADFADGGLRGEGLMAGITALINDTRGSIAGRMASGRGPATSPTPNGVEPK